jgi:hypothetical protein
MALADIVCPAGDGQDFVLELPAGNANYIPSDVLLGVGGAFLCAEIPVVTPGNGGGNIFVISD